MKNEYWQFTFSKIDAFKLEYFLAKRLSLKLSSSDSLYSIESSIFSSFFSFSITDFKKLLLFFEVGLLFFYLRMKMQLTYFFFGCFCGCRRLLNLLKFFCKTV